MSIDYQLEVDFPLYLEPAVALYQQIDEDYPDLFLTRMNSKIVKVDHSPSPHQPGRTFLTVEHNNGTVYRFRYLRLLLSDVLGERLFMELPNQPASTDILLNALNVRFGLQITASDVFVNNQNTKFIGGYDPYNYRLKARAESLVWVGQLVLSTATEDPTPQQQLGVTARRQAIMDMWMNAYRPQYPGGPYRDEIFYLGKVIREGFKTTDHLSGNAVIEVLDVLHQTVANAIL